MPLSHAELRTRIRIARQLRGKTQVALQRDLLDKGFDKTELGRIERGELQLTPMRRMMLARELNVPEEWFTEPDVQLGGVGQRPVADAPPPPPGALGHELSDRPPTTEDQSQTENPEEEDTQEGSGG